MTSLTYKHICNYITKHEARRVMLKSGLPVIQLLLTPTTQTSFINSVNSNRRSQGTDRDGPEDKKSKISEKKSILFKKAKEVN